MSDDRGASEPSELIYLPEPSWLPVLVAAGLAGIVASIFTWWPYGIIGAIVVLVALRVWIRDSRREFSRLPRRQRLTAAVIPAVPLKK